MRDSIDKEFKGTFRVPVFYISNFLPLAILLLDFSLNGLKVNIKLVILNIFLTAIYFVITLLGELAMGDPIYIKVSNESTYALSWVNFNIKK